MAIVAAIMFALAAVATRRLKSLNYSVIQFHYAVISTIVTGVWLAYEVKNNKSKDEEEASKVFALTYDTQILFKMVGLGLTTFVGSNIVTCMNQSTNPATVGLFLYIQIVYDISIDYAVFDTVLNGI